MTTEVATTDDTSVPALIKPALGGALSGRHITLPRLYKGEGMSTAVGDGLVKPGDIYVAQGSEDPEPEVIASTAKGDESSPPIRAHVIAVKLGLSVKKPGEQLRTFAYFDPNAPADARETFDYTLLLPTVDETIPVKLLLSSTSTQTAKRMNFLLLALEDEARWPELAFDITLKPRERTEGGKTQKWFVWQARQVDAKPVDVEAAKAASERFGIAGDVTPPASEAPAVAPPI